MYRKTVSLYYPLLIYLSLIEPLSLFSIIPILFFLGNNWIKKYVWVYYILGTLTLLITFFFFQMTTQHELIAILSATVAALILRETEKVPFWSILIVWLGLLGWFSGPLAALCVLLAVWMEWEWYNKTLVTIVLLVLLFFPLPMRTSFWWMPKETILREAPQRFGFHNYEGKYHQMAPEADPGAGTQSQQVSFSHTKTWMENIVDWTVFILAFMVIVLLIRLLFMLRQIRFKLAPYLLRSLYTTGISTIVIGSIVLFYRMAFMNFGDLPPDSPITAIVRQFKAPTTVSTVSPKPTSPLLITIRSIPLSIQYTILIVITVCLFIGIILLGKLLVQLFETSFTPDKPIPSSPVIELKLPPDIISWDKLTHLPVPQIIDKVYTYIRSSYEQVNYLTPYEFLAHFPSDALQVWTSWIVNLHYQPTTSKKLPSRKTVGTVFSQLFPG